MRNLPVIIYQFFNYFSVFIYQIFVGFGLKNNKWANNLGNGNWKVENANRRFA